MPVVLSGVDELKRALKKYAPDLRKEMDATIRAELKSVINETRDKVPGSPPGGLYGWQDKGQDVVSRTSKSRAFPRYNQMLIRKGLVYRSGTSKRQKPVQTGKLPTTGGNSTQTPARRTRRHAK